jgi:hypothetical protein
MSSNEEQSLQDFLKTPLNVSTVTVDTSTTGDFLTLSLPGIANSFTPWTSKLQNIRFLRADIKLEFYINPQPFAKGRLWIYFIPFESMLGTKLGTIGDANVFIYQGVEVDVGTSSRPSLIIPYCAPALFFDLLQGTGYLGQLRYRVIDPLSGTASSERFQLTTFMSLVNVSTVIRASVPTPIIGQSQEEAVVAAKEGLISGSFKRISDIATLWKPVPIVGPYAGKIGWFSDLISGKAAALGLSKPQNLMTPVLTERTVCKGLTNTDSVDVGSVMLGMSARNEVAKDPNLFSSSICEMDLSFVLARPSLVKRITWSSSDLGGAQLATMPVNPHFSDSATPGGTHPSTLLSFVAANFQLWTGSMRYRISVVKNKFYSGRLEVSFWSGQNAPIAATLSNPVPRWEIDLSTSSELLIEIPYASAFPWKPLTNGSSSFIGLTIATGTLVFRVLNDLRTQDAQSQNVTILVFASGGPDLRFSYFEEPQLLVAQSEEDETLEKTADHNDQERTHVALSPGQRAFQIGPSDINFEVATTGEAVVSIAQLIRRFGFFGQVSSFSPFSIDTRWFNSYGTPCPIDMFSNIFRFYSGSIRYKILMTVPPRTSAGVPIKGGILTAYMGRTLAAVQLNFNLIALPSSYTGPFHFVFTDKVPALEVTVPFYHTAPISLITDASQQIGENAPYISITFGYPGAVAGDLPPTFVILKAAGDDFQFGCLVAPPQLTY